VAGALVLVALAVAALAAHERIAASNARTFVSAVAVPLPPGERRCHGGEHVPAAADRLRVHPGTPEGRPGQPLRIQFHRRSGERVMSLDVAGGWRAGPMVLDLPPRPELELVRVCIENRGSEENSMLGNYTSPNPADPGRINGPFQPPDEDLPRMEFLMPGTPSAASVSADIGERSALFRAKWQGSWTPWVAIIALVAAATVALRLLWQSFGRGSA
jgi:hypothetical protein